MCVCLVRAYDTYFPKLSFISAYVNSESFDLCTFTIEYSFTSWGHELILTPLSENALYSLDRQV